MIMVVLQFGGIGIMSIGTYFWFLVKRRIGMRERQLIMVDNNQYSLAGVVLSNSRNRENYLPY